MRGEERLRKTVENGREEKGGDRRKGREENMR